MTTIDLFDDDPASAAGGPSDDSFALATYEPADPTDAIALATRELTPDAALSLRTAFEAMFDQAEEWSRRALAIRVTSVDQKREMKLARESRLALKEIRTNAEKTRKRLKEEYVRKGKAIDGVANVLKDLIAPIEAHLLEQEQFADRVAADQQRALDRQRAEDDRKLAEEQAARQKAEEQARWAEAQAERDRQAQADSERRRREAEERAAVMAAENERLRREAAEREAAEAADRERRAAEEQEARQARAEAEAEARRLREVEEAQLRAERQANAAAQAERERLEAELAAAVAAEATARAEAEALLEAQTARETLVADVLIAQAPAPANAAADASVLPAPSFDEDPGWIGSASGSARLLSCPASVALPQVHRAGDRYTERGHAVHGYIRDVLSGIAPDVAIRSVAEEHRRTCEKLDWRKLVGDIERFECEVAYRLNVKDRTGRRLGANLGRAYPKRERPWEEMDGTLDIEGWTRDGRLVVVDAKSGFVEVLAEDNKQGLTLAASLREVHGVSEVEFRIAKIKPSGDIWIDVTRFGAWEIDSHLDNLEDAANAARAARRVYLAGGVPNVSEGVDNCRWCPASDSCPAKTTLARHMLGALSPLERAIETMTPEQKRDAWELAHDKALPMAQRIVKALQDSARRDPFPLADDLELREAPYEKRSLDVEALTALARELGATDAQIERCYRVATIRPVRACKVDPSRGRRAS